MTAREGKEGRKKKRFCGLHLITERQLVPKEEKGKEKKNFERS